MAKRMDICTPRKKKDGGTFWVKIGTAWEGDKGWQLVFDALPLPDAEGRCVANLFEPRDNGGQRTQQPTDRTRARQADDGWGDEVPY